jgi:hypothetical protein
MSDSPKPRRVYDEPLNDPYSPDDWVHGRDAHEDVPGHAVPPDLAADPTAFGVPSAPEDDPDVNTDPTPGPDVRP